MLDISLSVFQTFESPLLKILCLYLHTVFSWIIWLWYLVSWFLMYSDHGPLSNMEFMKVFSHSVGCYFFPKVVSVSFALQKLFSLIRFHLFIFNLSACLVQLAHSLKSLSKFKKKTSQNLNWQFSTLYGKKQKFQHSQNNPKQWKYARNNSFKVSICTTGL